MSKPRGAGSRISNVTESAMLLTDRVPGLRRTLLEITRVEVLDRSVIIAAQALFSVTPLLVVVAAFLPESLSSTVSDQLSDVMGLGDAPSELSRLATAEQVQTETGILGAVIVLFSAISFGRAVQRLYERVWEKRHLGGVPGARRCLVWLLVWVLYLQSVSLVLNAITGAEWSWLKVVFQLSIGTLAWWWTAHMLLAARVPWPGLLLGALLTSIGITVLVRLSGNVMPTYVKSSVRQFGEFGLLFAASSWLIVFGCVLVVAAILGRVITEEPRLHPPFTTRWLRSSDGINA